MGERFRVESPGTRKPQLISPSYHWLLGHSQPLSGKSNANKGILLIVKKHHWVVGWREMGQIVNALASSLFTATPLPNGVWIIGQILPRRKYQMIEPLALILEVRVTHFLLSRYHKDSGKAWWIVKAGNCFFPKLSFHYQLQPPYFPGQSSYHAFYTLFLHTSF